MTKLQTLKTSFLFFSFDIDCLVQIIHNKRDFACVCMYVLILQLITINMLTDKIMRKYASNSQKNYCYIIHAYILKIKCFSTI